MRHALFVLTLLLASAAAAQVPLADSTTWYVSPLLGYAYTAGGVTADGVTQSSTQAGGAGLLVGRRVSESVDIGFQAMVLDVREAGSATQVMFGPQIGFTQKRGEYDQHTRFGVTAVVGESPYEGAVSGFQSVGLQAATTVSRSYPITRSLRFAPTAGLFGTVCSSRNDGLLPGAGCSQLSGVTGIEFTFRAFGADVSLPLLNTFGIAGNTGQSDSGPFSLQGAPVTTGLSFRF